MSGALNWIAKILGSVLVANTAAAQILLFDSNGRPIRPAQPQQARPVTPSPAPIATETDPAKSKDPRVYCADFKRKDVIIDGEKQQRFIVSDEKYRSCLPPQPKAPWTVLKEQWDDQDEKNWQTFVKTLGESKCNTVDTCLASQANLYRDQLDLDATHYSDCADFPMFIRAYFSFKNNLPFTMVFGHAPNELTPLQQKNREEERKVEEANGTLEKFEKAANDVRYSLNGNHPAGRYSIPASVPATRDFFKVVSAINDVISSGSYRMFNTATSFGEDFYSPAITRESIKPGTVLYKVTGHLALVYDVTKDGEVKYIDAHPDNSVSRGSFSREYPRSNPFQGGGFKNWRPFKVVNAKRGQGGAIVQGQIRLAKDEEIPDYSAEQYYGNKPAADWNWKDGKFVVRGREVNFYEYVAIRLFDGDYKVNPLKQFQKGIDSICADLRERTNSVQTAIEKKINEQPHPQALPNNIYGADGEWESYSTPGRDLRIRKAVLDLIDDAKDAMKKWYAKDPYFDYQGDNLKRDLLLLYNQADQSCRISYTNSQGIEVRMGLSTAISRITKMSFDPYFCPERRWGAKTAAELKSCMDQTDKVQWYEFTQFLRNQTVKDPTAVMGYTLADAKRISQQQAKDAQDATSRFNIQKALQGL